MGIEEMRVAQAKTYVDTGLAAKKAAEAHDRVVKSEWAEEQHVAAVKQYQAQVTPLEERVRETQVEREVQAGKGRSAGAATRAKVAERAGDVEAQKAAEAEIKAVDIPTITESYAQARGELAAEGYTAEQMVTPIVDLKTTSEPVVEGLDLRVDSAVKKLLLLGVVSQVVKSLSKE